MKNTEKKNLLKCFFKTQREYRTINLEKTIIMALTHDNNINQSKARDHCHYIGEYRGAADNASN